MHIAIRVTVTEGPYSSRTMGDSEVSINTQATWPESLPWTEICSCLVETAIEDFRAKVKAGEEEK